MYLANEVTAVRNPVVADTGSVVSVIINAAGAAGNAFVKVTFFAVAVLQPLAFCAWTVMSPTDPIPGETFLKFTFKMLASTPSWDTDVTPSAWPTIETPAGTVQ